MRESLRNTERGLIFRETFNDQQAVERNGGVITDVAFSNGKGVFDAGNPGYITYGYYPKINETSPFSIRIKVNITDLSSANNFLNIGTGWTTGIILRVDNTGLFRLKVANREGYTTTGVIQIGVDYELVATFDGGNVVGLYVDTVKSDITNTGTKGTVVFENLVVGARSGSSGLNGSMELLEIYNYALSAEEVSNLYNSSRHFELAGHGEQVGEELVTDIKGSAVHPYETLEISGLDIISAINTSVNATVYDEAMSLITAVGDKYRFTCDFVLNSGDSPKVLLVIDGENISGTTSNTVNPTDGHFSAILTATAGNSSVDLAIWNNTASNFSMTNISLKKIVIPEVKEILNVSAQSGSIVNKYAGDKLDNIYTNTNAWIDSNDDGIADDWIDQYSKPDYISIVTGNGFNGHAQRLDNDGTNSVAIYQLIQVTAGKTYHVRMIYRAGSGFRMQTGIIHNPPENTGDAVLYEFDVVASSTAYVYFRVSAFADSWFEIDDLSIQEVIPEPVITATEVVKDGDVRGMLMNGIDSKVDCGDYDDLIGDKTFIAWIKPHSWGEADTGRIFNNGKLIFGISLTVGVVEGLILSSNAATVANSNNNAIEIGEWIFVCAVRESDGTVTFYVNGIDETLDSVSGTPVVASTNLFMGSQNDGQATWKGLIDGRVEDGLMTAKEISQLYTSEKHKYNL